MEEKVTPLTDLFHLSELPYDLQKETALKLPFDSIISLCKSSRGFNRLCNNIYFWKNYFNLNIKEKINIPEDASIHWYQDKIRKYKDVKTIIELNNQDKVTPTYIQNFDENWDIFERII